VYVTKLGHSSLSGVFQTATFLRKSGVLLLICVAAVSATVVLPSTSITGAGNE
jgi:hypothetical protein